MDRILRITDLVSQLRLSRATIYRQMRAGTFPKPMALGPRAVGWTEEQVTTWLKSRPSAAALRTQRLELHDEITNQV